MSVERIQNNIHTQFDQLTSNVTTQEEKTQIVAGLDYILGKVSSLPADMNTDLKGRFTALKGLMRPSDPQIAAITGSNSNSSTEMAGFARAIRHAVTTMAEAKKEEMESIFFKVPGLRDRRIGEFTDFINSKLKLILINSKDEIEAGNALNSLNELKISHSHPLNDNLIERVDELKEEYDKPSLVEPLGFELAYHTITEKDREALVSLFRSIFKEKVAGFISRLNEEFNNEAIQSKRKAVQELSERASKQMKVDQDDDDDEVRAPIPPVEATLVDQIADPVIDLEKFVPFIKKLMVEDPGFATEIHTKAALLGIEDCEEHMDQIASSMIEEMEIDAEFREFILDLYNSTRDE